MPGTPISDNVSTKLQRIAQLAREDMDRQFLSLAHHIDIEFLREAFRRTRKDGAPGVDGQTAAQYAENLEDNLQSLLNRFKSGRYHAPPVRRTYIPKGDGSTKRPIGIPTIEDKILQRAVAMVLVAVYEQDFLDCSHAFRPDRSPRGALGALRQGLMSMGGGWVLELDIQSFFDKMDHRRLRTFLDRRVRDGVLRRTIDKWLAAGVLEQGSVSYPGVGTPQGGVVSPILANVYLHEVLDTWFEGELRGRLKGRAFMIRYADDAVLVFSNEADARQAMTLLVERFALYGLRLHPTKTRLMQFYPPRPEDGRDGEPRGFDFLGLVHHWARSRRGQWVVKRKTAPSRMSRTLKRQGQWCRRHRHKPVAWQHAKLVQALRGHDNHYGYRENTYALKHLRYWVTRIWKKWLMRRTRKSQLTWDRFNRLFARYPLPPPRFMAEV